jgi:uncharacterized glyoxalase superfamily protein PhnB
MTSDAATNPARVKTAVAPLLSVRQGARVVTAVTNDYGWRLGRVADPFGHHWEVGRPLQ